MVKVLIDVNLDEIQKILEKKVNLSEIKKIINSIIGCRIIREVSRNKILIEVPYNRLDLYSTWGIERTIKKVLGNKTRDIEYNEIAEQIYVDTEIAEDISISCAIIENYNFNKHSLEEITRFLRNILENYCDRGQRASIILCDYDKIQGPLTFLMKKIDLEKIINAKEKDKIIKELSLYATIFKDGKYGLLIDSNNKIVAIPPIIMDSVRVTSETSNIVVVGISPESNLASNVVNIFITNVLEKGGILKGCEIIYSNKKVITPILEKRKIIASADEIFKIIGLEIEVSKLLKLLNIYGYSAKEIDNKKLEITVPFYRIDVKHIVDIVDDLILLLRNELYSHSKFIKVINLGRKQPLTILMNKIREVLSNLGFQEIMTHTLTNSDILIKKMNLKSKDNIVKILNPILETYSCIRNWLTPCILEFLSINKHAKYPQKIFEINNVAMFAHNKGQIIEDIHLVAAISDGKVGYEDIYPVLIHLMKALNIEFKLVNTYHASFIRGRCARVISYNGEVGIIGEVHPMVLRNFNLTKPTALFELSLSGLIRREAYLVGPRRFELRSRGPSGGVLL